MISAILQLCNPALTKDTVLKGVGLYIAKIEKIEVEMYDKNSEWEKSRN